MQPLLKHIIIVLTCLPFFSMASVTEPTKNNTPAWQTSIPVFKQDFDWLMLSSGEWLKGDIVSMYDEKLEFDSDELNMQTIDWSDVSELRSKDILSLRMNDGQIVEGLLVVKEGVISLVNHGQSTNYKVNELLSIASSGANEWDLWDGYVNLGVNLRRGNTKQFDYTLIAGVQRRSSTGRFKTDYTANYSESEITNDDSSKQDVVTADSQRLTSSYDWFFSQKIFFRVVEFEYTSDAFLNIDYRINYGVALGYRLIDNSRTTFDITAGPSYQQTKFINVQPSDDDSETSAVLSLGTLFEYELSNDIDYDAQYQIQINNKASGEYIHHFQTGLEIDLAGDFDLDLTFYLDRTESPKANELGELPEKNDYRLVVSLGYDF